MLIEGLNKKVKIDNVLRIPEGSIFTNLKLCDCIFIKKIGKKIKTIVSTY